MKESTLAILLFAASFFVFCQHLDRHGLEWRDDEIFYYQSTREMLQEHNYFSPTYFGENRFQKPILFYWLILAAYQLLGVNWVAARIVAVIAASLVVVLTYAIGRELFGRRLGVLSSLIVATIPLFFRHAKNAVPDMTLDLFIVLAMYLALKFFREPQRPIYRTWFFLACALGFMIKGFAALVIPLLSVLIYGGLMQEKNVLKRFNFPLGIMLILAVILPWFLYMMKVHGDTYTHYVLKAETMNRLVAESPEPFPVKIGKTFLANSWFYVKTIFSYFAPWSAFAVVAVPWSFVALARKPGLRKDWLFPVVWFWVAFLFFSFIFARINHLILVLTTPFAIIMSGFFLEEFSPAHWAGKGLAFVKKFAVIFLVALGSLGLSFLRVFLAGQSGLWLWVYFAVFVLGLGVVLKSRSAAAVPAVMGGFLVFSLLQSGLVSDVGLTAHSVLQKFAEKIEAAPPESRVIGVGSNDIHEKEWQVYFTDPVLKVANDEIPETEAGLRKLFADGAGKTVYCLMLRRDYENFQKTALPAKIEVIAQELIFRRRIYVDKGFFLSILKLDRSRVQATMMEPVVLLRKG